MARCATVAFTAQQCAAQEPVGQLARQVLRRAAASVPIKDTHEQGTGHASKLCALKGKRGRRAFGEMRIGKGKGNLCVLV